MSEEVKKKRGRPKGSSNGQKNHPVNNAPKFPRNDIPNNIRAETRTEPKNNIRTEPKNNIRTEPKNNNIVSDNTEPDNIDTEQDDADLKAFLKDKKKMQKNDDSILMESNDEFDESLVAEIESLESKEGLNDIPSDDFDPLDEAVKQRDYTGGINYNQNAGNPNQQERVIEEPAYQANGASKPDVDDNLINPTSNDIPNDSSNGGGSGGGNSNNNSHGKSNDSSNSSGGEKTQPKQENDNLKELTAAEKRDAMEKTADAILLAYKSYIPLPFVYFASYDSKKLEKLHNADQIDLETQVKRDGTTFREHAKDFNKNVEAAFEVTDAEVEALKDPLVDVLMEQEFAFTPTQRLMFVGGQFLVAKVMMCVKFLREKKSDIQEMKDIHAEKMEQMQKMYEKNQKKTSTKEQEKPNVTFTNKTEKTETKTDNTTNSTQSTTSSNDKDITDAEIISETKNPSDNLKVVTPTLEDVLNTPETDEAESDDNDDTNDIPE